MVRTKPAMKPNRIDMLPILVFVIKDIENLKIKLGHAFYHCKKTVARARAKSFFSRRCKGAFFQSLLFFNFKVCRSVFCKILFLLALLTANLALSSSDEIFSYWKKGRFNQAIDLCGRSQQSLLASTIEASRLLDPFYQGHYRSAAMDFLNKNPLWIQRTAIIQKGESLMHRWTTRDIVLWCTKYPPISSKGQKLYLAAFIKQFGLTDRAVSLIRKYWVCCSFSQLEMQDYLSQYGNFLSICDHQNRLTERVMEADVEGIKLLLPMLDLPYRKKAQQCILLFEQDKKAEPILSFTDNNQIDSDLIYAFFKSHRQDRLMPKKSLMLLADSLLNSTLKDAHLPQWTNVRNIVARELVVYKEYKKAYKIVASSANGSQFLSGWIALNFLGQPKLALGHFVQMSKLARSSHNYAKSHYWIARSLMQLNKTEEARIAFHRSGFFYFTFYGQLSLLALNKQRFCYFDSSLVKTPLKGNQEMLKVVCLLKQYGRYDIARPMCKALFARLTRSEILFALDVLLMTTNEPQARHWNCIIGELASERGVFTTKYLYPSLDCVPFKSLSESCLIHAIVKQESVFNAKAVSESKALGLMQILPHIGLKLAEKSGTNIANSHLLDSKTNLTLGNMYLKDLLRRYRGNIILALAAYNAGPSNVFQWRKNNGKLSACGTIAQAIEWIEKIPFPSTSRYVESVIANKVVYQSLSSGDSKISLLKELGIVDEAKINTKHKK
jgi:soluble lytic murein transglycosylase